MDYLNTYKILWYLTHGKASLWEKIVHFVSVSNSGVIASDQQQQPLRDSSGGLITMHLALCSVFLFVFLTWFGIPYYVYGRSFTLAYLTGWIGDSLGFESGGAAPLMGVEKARRDQLSSVGGME